jgi:outer membrane biosynthesis protein TonB
MTRFSVLVAFSLLLLTACSDSKGPGALGSKDDIVIRNNGMPQAQQNSADFSSTVEQGEAVPAPDVAAPEPIAPVEPVQEIQSPESAPTPQEQPSPSPAQSSAPPVTQPVEPAPVSAPEESVIAPPMGEAVAPPPAPAQAPTAPSINVNDPAVILAVQTAMRASGVYTGKLNGEISMGYLNALSKYQAMHKLPQGGLNDQTLRHMRLIP